MRALRRQVLAHDVDRWARSFLDALAEANPNDAK
jgi:trehalose 6-phosphate synthase